MGTSGKSPKSSQARRSSAVRVATTPELVRALLPCEIRVVDEERREIEVCATSEAVDAHGTIFDYEASRDAFSRWAGNVREMHERKAVGRKVAVRYDDDARRVYVRLRISAGAQDTWEKVKDGTLTGASIGASNVAWRNQRRAGADVPVAISYDLVELSLVDLPSNPDASGVTFVRTFVRDGVPDAALLDALDSVEDAPAAAPAAVETPAAAPAAVQIREGAGNLGADDPAAAIAAAALARGHAAVAAGATQGSKLREGDVAGGHTGSGVSGSELREGESTLTANQRRLARLGAPGYVALANGANGANAAGDALAAKRAEAHTVATILAHDGVRVRGIAPAFTPAAAAVTRAAAGDEAPGALYDEDGDHDMAEGELAHADDMHAHDAHDHAHTGGWDDAHTHGGPHIHEDGTSHEHDHAHDHGHHDHSTAMRDATRAQAGHSHAHVHAHDHGHYYRVADGAPVDERLVTGEQARTREYVSEIAFQAAGGVSGKGLSAAQYRIAAGVELRLELAAAERAQGAFSRNPYGAADIGTPAVAQEAPTDAAMTAAATSTGAVRPLDRDGQPTADDENAAPSTGTLDVSAAPEGYLEITDQRTRSATSAQAARYEPEAEAQRALASAVAAAVAAEVSRVTAPLTAIEQRLARIEAQPMPGGPVFRSADKSTPLSPSAGAGAGAGEQIRALEALAGRIADPQAQVAVAAEMIRLQQEAAGMPVGYQVMPRAGRGWGDGK